MHSCILLDEQSADRKVLLVRLIHYEARQVKSLLCKVLVLIIGFCLLICPPRYFKTLLNELVVSKKFGSHYFPLAFVFSVQFGPHVLYFPV